VVVLGLPRGGVPVAAEVARALHAPLDVFVVRKLGTPGQQELAMGAIASGGVRVLNDEVIGAAHISPETVDRVTAQEAERLAAREAAYRGARPPLALEDKVVIVVDDGMATGSSMKAALAAVRRHHPRHVVTAVPTGAAQTCAELEAGGLVDEVVCAMTPAPFIAVGVWYRDFTPTSDEQVSALVAAGANPVPSEQPGGPEGEQPDQR
jgi:putative phosphoribosyl transferase